MIQFILTLSVLFITFSVSAATQWTFNNVAPTKSSISKGSGILF